MHQHRSPDDTDQNQEQAYPTAEFSHFTLLLPNFMVGSVKKRVTFDKKQAGIDVLQLQKQTRRANLLYQTMNEGRECNLILETSFSFFLSLKIIIRYIKVSEQVTSCQGMPG